MSEASPYRTALPIAEASDLRRSWWQLGSSLATTLVVAGFAIVLFREVAQSWVGDGVAGVVALGALLSATTIGTGRVAACPRCGHGLAIDRAATGHVCAGCGTALVRDRAQLIAAGDEHIAERPCYGAPATAASLPAGCSVCGADEVRRASVKLGTTTALVPYCAAHDGGVDYSKDSPAAMFWWRSLAYARACAGRDQVRGRADTRATPRQERGSALGIAIALVAVAAGTYYGLGALEDSGYQVTGGNARGFLVWLVITLVGRAWLAAIFAAIAAVFFGQFASTFRPPLGARDPRATKAR
jgi:predicted RNA-binding Zn-ribbon protein involved in translation (DUF1610 family)